MLTLVLSVDFNLERLYRRERGERARGAACGDGARGRARAASTTSSTRRRTGSSSGSSSGACAGSTRPREQRLAYHDRATLTVLANFGLSTQLAVLGVCLALGAPVAYLWFAIGCGVALVPLRAAA